MTLEPGSLLVFYSDGLIERRGELLSDRLDRLKSAGTSLVGLPIADVCEQLVVALGVETSREDDVAVLAAAVRSTHRGADSTSSSRLNPASSVSSAPRCATGWTSGDVGAADQNALLLAVGEACSNAIEHAYQGRAAGKVNVEIEETPDRKFAVTVRDFGRFRSPSAPKSPDRGRGTSTHARAHDRLQPRLDAHGHDRALSTAGGRPRAVMSDQLLSTRFERSDGSLLVRLSGEIDLSNSHAVASTSSKAPSKADARVVIDLTEIKYLDSQGLRLIKQLVEQGRR